MASVFSPMLFGHIAFECANENPFGQCEVEAEVEGESREQDYVGM